MGKKISQRAFANQLGVSPGTICAMCRPGRPLASAWDGKKLDSAHPEVLKYVEGRTQVLLAPPLPARSAQLPAPARTAKQSAELPEAPEDIRDLMDRTLREILESYATDERFFGWLRATKEIENVHKLRLFNAAKESELVSREIVEKGILSPVDSAHVRLLQDGCVAMATRAIVKVAAGDDAAELSDFFRAQITSFIKPLKAQIKRTLENR